MLQNELSSFKAYQINNIEKKSFSQGIASQKKWHDPRFASFDADAPDTSHFRNIISAVFFTGRYRVINPYSRKSRTHYSGMSDINQWLKNSQKLTSLPNTAIVDPSHKVVYFNERRHVPFISLFFYFRSRLNIYVEPYTGKIQLLY